MSAQTMMQPRLERSGAGGGAGERFGQRADLWAVAGLLILCGVWLLALRCPFTDLDDPIYIQNNPIVQRGLTPAGVAEAFTSTTGGFWLPMTWISLALDARLFGTGPLGFHLTNAVLHAANVVLVYVFLRGTTGSVWRSFAAAALWGVHPLRVESVAWAAERKDVLSAFFGLLALLAYVRYARRRSGSGLGVYLGSVALLALSLLAKPMLVTFPFLLLVVDFWPLQRWSKRNAGALLTEKVPFLLIAAVDSYITYAMQAGKLVGGTSNPLGLRVENALLSYGLYLRDMVYFGKLSLWYPRLYAIAPLHVMAAGAVVGAITAAVLWMQKRGGQGGGQGGGARAVLAGWLWFLGTLVPTLGLLQSGEQARADRFTYFPAMGLAMLVVWSAPERWVAGPAGRRAMMGAAAAAVGACVVFTAARIMLWWDPVALYQQGIARTGNNWMLEMSVGDADNQRGDRAGAIAAYTRAVTIAPTLHEIQNNLGSMLAQEGRLDLAVEHFHQAYETRPGNPVYAENYHRAMSMLATRSAPAGAGSQPSQEHP